MYIDINYLYIYKIHDAKYHIVNSLMESTARIMFTISCSTFCVFETFNIEPIAMDSKASK